MINCYDFSGFLVHAPVHVLVVDDGAPFVETMNRCPTPQVLDPMSLMLERVDIRLDPDGVLSLGGLVDFVAVLQC